MQIFLFFWFEEIVISLYDEFKPELKLDYEENQIQ